MAQGPYGFLVQTALVALGCLSSWLGVYGAIPAWSVGHREEGTGWMGSVSHPNPVLPIPSSIELPLTKHSVELGVGGHKLVDMSGCPQRKPGQGAWGRGGRGPPCHSDTKSPLLTWQGTQRLSHLGQGSKPSPDANVEVLAEPGARSCPGYRGSSSQASLAGFHGGSRNSTTIREEQSEQEESSSIPGEVERGWGTWGSPQGRGETGWSPARACTMP